MMEVLSWVASKAEVEKDLPLWGLCWFVTSFALCLWVHCL